MLLILKIIVPNATHLMFCETYPYIRIAQYKMNIVKAMKTKWDASVPSEALFKYIIFYAYIEMKHYQMMAVILLLFGSESDLS